MLAADSLLVAQAAEGGGTEYPHTHPMEASPYRSAAQCCLELCRAAVCGCLLSSGSPCRDGVGQLPLDPAALELPHTSELQGLSAGCVEVTVTERVFEVRHGYKHLLNSRTIYFILAKLPFPSFC